MATRSPRPFSTCRSRALYAALTSPPTNHFANGGFDQSSASSKSLLQDSSSRACLAQNAGRSAAASWYSSAFTTALAAKSSDGANLRFSCSRFSRASPCWLGVAAVAVEPGVSWDMVNLIIHRSLLRGAPVPAFARPHGVGHTVWPRRGGQRPVADAPQRAVQKP